MQLLEIEQRTPPEDSETLVRGGAEPRRSVLARLLQRDVTLLEVAQPRRPHGVGSSADAFRKDESPETLSTTVT